MNRTATIHKLSPRSLRRGPRSSEPATRSSEPATRSSKPAAKRLDVALAASRERRHGGPSQDRALYSCSCGLAFDALVSTSVGCPHCGRTQAW